MKLVFISVKIFWEKIEQKNFLPKWPNKQTQIFNFGNTFEIELGKFFANFGKVNQCQIFKFRQNIQTWVNFWNFGAVNHGRIFNFGKKFKIKWSRFFINFWNFNLGQIFILGNNSKWSEVDSSTIFEILANTVEVLSLSSDYVPTNVTIWTKFFCRFILQKLISYCICWIN